MKNRNIVFLLNIIAAKGNVKRLLNEGLSFKDISNLTEEASDLNLLEYKDKKIIITKKGEEYLSSGLDLIKRTNKADWISKENKSKIKKLEKNFIFLPNQNELFF